MRARVRTALSVAGLLGVVGAVAIGGLFGATARLPAATVLLVQDAYSGPPSPAAVIGFGVVRRD